MATNPFLDPNRDIVQGKTDVDILREWQERLARSCERPLEDILTYVGTSDALEELEEVRKDLEEIRKATGDYLAKVQGWSANLKGNPAGTLPRDIEQLMADMITEFKEDMTVLSGCSSQLKGRYQDASDYLGELRKDLRAAVLVMQAAERDGDTDALRKASEHSKDIMEKNDKLRQYQSAVGGLRDETDTILFDITLTVETIQPLMGAMAAGTALAAGMSAYKAIRKAVSSATGKKGQNGQSGGTP